MIIDKIELPICGDEGKGSMKKLLLTVVLLLFFCCPNVYSQIFGDESLKKRYVINTSELNIVKNIVGDICNRWSMDRSNLKIYSGQELLYVRLSRRYPSQISNYCAVLSMDNKIYIDICDSLTPKSKWFDNFPLFILWELDRNKITYSEMEGL
jgi:hypothetical protein